MANQESKQLVHFYIRATFIPSMSTSENDRKERSMKELLAYARGPEQSRHDGGSLGLTA